MWRRYPLVSFFGPFDHRDFENHSRLTNLTDIQNIATELVHPLDHTESGYRDPTVRTSLPLSSDGVVRKRLRGAWLLGCRIVWSRRRATCAAKGSR